MTFRGDKWNKFYGSRIPIGSEVELIKYMPRRRVLIRYGGELINTMAWCIKRG